MKKISKSALVLEVLGLPNIQKTLERLGDLLTKVQKSLGGYLERQRTAFARFYFIGDEDLLEIIGSGRDISRIQKHLKKMFAGVNRVLLSDDNNVVAAPSQFFCANSKRGLDCGGRL
jgi:dynein heavy chain 1